MCALWMHALRPLESSTRTDNLVQKLSSSPDLGTRRRAPQSLRVTETHEKGVEGVIMISFTVSLGSLKHESRLET